MRNVSGNPFTAEQVAERQRTILGQPVRIRPMATLTEEALAVSNWIRGTIGSGRPPSTDVSEVPEIIGISLKHPDLYRRQVEMGIQIAGKDAALSVRDREIAVLRVGWLCQAPFEWNAHVLIGRSRGGLSDEEIERTTQGSAAEGWSRHDRAILKAVEELLSDAYISDETWATLAESYDDKQLLELPALVGVYQTTAYVQNSVRYRLNEASTDGLMAR